jgi:hypothetical protein
VQFGPDLTVASFTTTGVAARDQKALNAGVAFRFTATQAKKIYSVKINCSAITLGSGVINVRVETIDATTGKPSGTLYDANATITTPTFTWVTGWNTITFASAPTTNLTVGSEYAIVILTSTAATAFSLRADMPVGGQSRYPNILLTSTDLGTTWAEVASTIPIASLLLEDGTEDPMWLLPYAVVTTNNLINDDATALRFTVPTGVSLVVEGVSWFMIKVGTPPAGSDIRIRIFDSADSTVANSTRTVDLDSLSTGSTGRRCVAIFSAMVTLAAGTYRVVFDCASSTSSANCWNLKSAIPAASTYGPSGFQTSTAPAIASPVWTDTNEQLPVWLLISDVVGAGGGGGSIFGSVIS